jgi:alpha-1,2-mannosyltransferase
VALGAALVWYFYLILARPGMLGLPADLTVYRDAGLIVRHVRPFFDPRRPSPLYNWPGPPGLRGLTFTYPPFAALPFALMSYLPLHLLDVLAAAADLVAVPATIWIGLGALGWPAGQRRLGFTMLATAIALMTEPVQRTIYLGQVNILLMVLIVWDLCQPDRRWWKGAGVGLAAAIKLVPLIFIPYLLITKRFKQAAVAVGTFAATVVIGWIVLPADSTHWWLDGTLTRDSRYPSLTRFAGNQSLLGLFERSGSSAWHAEWLAAAVLAAMVGLAAAALLDRAGHALVGVVTVALTGLLVSPISWDHHWVWIVLAAPIGVHYALRARGIARWALLGLAGTVPALFGTWAIQLWGEKFRRGWDRGLIWVAYNKTSRVGAWHGWQVILGNAYVLTGVVLVLVLAAIAVAPYLRLSRPREAGSAEHVPELP